MKCSNCGKRLTPKTGLYAFEDEYLGRISVELKGSHECKPCDDVYLSWEDAGRVEQAENDVEEQLLQSKPVSDFVTQKETAEILGISKQAVSKNHRIKRGFIFSNRIRWPKNVSEEISRTVQRKSGRPFPTN